MMIVVKENINNVDEFNLLYDAVGWGSYDISISSIALKNTFYSVSVYDNDMIIGFGRIVGDGICFLHIHDVMVLPKYQNKKIGAKIMNSLLNKIDEVRQKNPDVLVYLGASLGKEDFYKKQGFITREEAGLGPGMILKD